MNARIQRWQLLLRTSLALAGLIGVWRYGGSPGLALLTAAVLFWFYGLLMGFVFFSLTRINRESRPGLVSLLRAWWWELVVVEWVFAWQQPFREHRVPDFLPAQSSQRGVLMLHGYTCNRGLWNGWMRRLREQSHPNVALSLEPAFGSIDAYTDQIETAVQKLEASTGQPPVIVAHSMGGLAARAWWRRHGRAGRIHRIVTLGSPHAGTLMANFAASTNARQMRRGSVWLAELSAQEPADFGAQFDCYFSACDHIVCPSSTTVMPGARAIEIRSTGHLALVFAPRVFNDVLALLQRR